MDSKLLFIHLHQGYIYIYIRLKIKPNSIRIRFLSCQIFAWNRSHDVFHVNMLPFICSLYDTGFKVLSMKINYLAPFKHKHNHQKFAHEN